MRKTIKMNSMFKSMLLMLCVAMVVAGTVLGSGIVEVQAATLSGYGLTKKESKEFTKILKSEAKKREITYYNSPQTTEWTSNGVKFKPGYTCFTEYCIKKINGKNIMCLYGEYPDDGTLNHVIKMYYMVNGKVKACTDAGSRMEVWGYSSSGIVFGIGPIACNYILTYKDGKIKVMHKIYGDNTGLGDYSKGPQGKISISKEEYDKIYNAYYDDGKYKEIKWKSIKSFK